jgi:subtilisin family serine protease
MMKLLLATTIITIAAASSADPRNCRMDHFHQRGSAAPLCIAQDLVAVEADQTAGDAEAIAAPLLAKARVRIARRDSAQPEALSRVVGVPVWFASEQKEPSVLTPDIVIRFTGKATADTYLKSPDVKSYRRLRVPGNVYVVTYETPETALHRANGLSEREDIVYAHPDFIIAKDFRTDDTWYDLQWHLHNTGQTGGTAGADIGIEGAFARTMGDPEILIAVLDMDFDILHEDLIDGIFLNRGEIPGNNIDDDGNGYIDDVRGWNFSDHTPSFNPKRADHGTAVAGLVGARSNGIGTTGTCPGCTILPVGMSFQPSDDAEAFHYAFSQHADIITNSWGYDLYAPVTDVVVDAINHAATAGRNERGTVILFAMTNTPYDNCKPDNPDISSLPAVFAISSTDHNDHKVKNAGWGDCLDFVAPSRGASGTEGIVTTDVTGTLGYNNGSDIRMRNVNYTTTFGGTSAATPSVAGVVGLMLSVNPELTRDEVKCILQGTTDKVDGLAAAYDATGFSKTHGWGRINAGAAVNAAMSP